MGKRFPPISKNRPAWFFCVFLAICSLILIIHSIWSFNRATIIVEWSTASELDIVGFNVLRADSETESFIVINEQIIPPSDDALVGGDYTFEDPGRQSGKTYYYLLEDVEFNGTRTQHGPVSQRAENHAKINLLLAGILTITTGFCAWIQIRKTKKISKS